jgi:hypothetical protein
MNSGSYFTCAAIKLKWGVLFYFSTHLTGLKTHLSYFVLSSSLLASGNNPIYIRQAWRFMRFLLATVLREIEWC